LVIAKHSKLLEEDFKMCAVSTKLNRNQQLERRTIQIWESQHRPITIKDFTEHNFAIDGIVYSKFTESQFYKCASQLQKLDKIMQLKKTIPAHYFPAIVKTNRREVPSSDFLTNYPPQQQEQQSPACTLGASFAVKFIEETVWGNWGLHNIHLAAFNVKDIYSILKDKGYRLTNRSHDIQLKPIPFKGLEIKPIIHCTNTLTVSVGCSYSPIIMNSEDVTRLDNALGQTVNALSATSGLLTIPNPNDWLCTEYHFGRDGENLFRGQPFEIVWKDAKHTYYHVYAKEYNEGYRLRDERYGYPFSPLEQVLNSKMIAA
jgi:hypothetical protein